MKPLEEFAEGMKWTRVGKPLKMLMSLNDAVAEEAWQLGRLMAEAVLKNN